MVLAIWPLRSTLRRRTINLNGVFIREMLIRINLPQGLIKLIISCVTSVSTSILFNGGNLEYFNPSRGIWQGDFLSPYLFILCMDFLSQLIEEKCMEKTWNLVKSSKGGPSFSHVFFVDDLHTHTHTYMLNFHFFFWFIYSLTTCSYCA